MKTKLNAFAVALILSWFPSFASRADNDPKNQGRLVIQDAYILKDKKSVEFTVGYTPPGADFERTIHMSADLGVQAFTSSIEKDETGIANQYGFSILPKIHVSAEWNMDQKTIEELEIRIGVFAAFSIEHWNYLKDYRHDSTFRAKLNVLDVGGFYEKDDVLGQRKEGVLLSLADGIMEKAFKVSGVPILFKIGADVGAEIGSFLFNDLSPMGIQIAWSPKIMSELGVRIQHAFDFVVHASADYEWISHQERVNMEIPEWSSSTSWKLGVALRHVLGLPVDVEYNIRGEESESIIGTFKGIFQDQFATYRSKKRQEVGIHVSF